MGHELVLGIPGKQGTSGQPGQLCGNGLMMSQVAGGAWEVAL